MSRMSAALVFAVALGSATAAVGDDEIIVTANKRGDARAQELPIAMNAFGENELAARNFEDLQSLSYALPNVQFEDIGTARGIANFSIRGVGVNSSIASVDPAVGLFVDGLYYGVNAGSLSDGFDIEAVEVLRGPQGTLYGRNVTGGAVLVRTRAPTDTFEARGRVAVETGPNVIAEAAVSGPIAPGLLSGRLAVLHSDDSGWFENKFNGAQFGASETNAWRGSLRLTPSPELEFLLRLEQGYIDGDGPIAQNHGLFARGGFDFSIDNRGYAATDWEQATLEANWRVAFGDGVITSITGWRDVEVPWSADIDSSPNFIFHTRVLNLQDQWSEELRYAGTFGAFDVTTGLYYLEQNLTYIDERNFGPVLGGSTCAFAASLCRTGGGQGQFLTVAAFADVNWRLNETLSLIAGLRYTEEEKDSRISRVRNAADNLDGANVVPGEGVYGGSIDAASLNFSDSPFSQSWNDVSPRAGVQWRPSPATNVYATWSRGFRSGGVNFRTSTLNTPPVPYDAEEQTTIELGWKQDFAEGRGRMNLALFQNDIDNMQRETNQPPATGTGVVQIVLNAGDARIWGGELELSYELTDNLQVAAFAGYTHGEYQRLFASLDADTDIDAADYALEIPRLAPWTYGVSFDYQRAVAGGELRTRIAYNHRDAAFYTDNNLGRLAEADIIDANLSWGPESGRWQVSLYGENLTDEANWGGDTLVGGVGVTGQPNTFSPLNKGRVVGAELRLRY